MTDREALTAALDSWDAAGRPKHLIYTAARERLAQLPDQYDVYPAELVEQLGSIIERRWIAPRIRAVAVLDALNRETL